MVNRTTYWLILLMGLVSASALLGCRSSEQIQATAPRPAVTPDADAALPTPRTPLTVVLDISEAALPSGVTSIRLRIPEIQFQHETGTWHSRRTPGGTIRVEEETAGQRTLLATSMPLGSYQALRIPVDNVHVEFGANAGGPVDVAEAASDSLVFDFEITRDAAVTLRLNFDTIESLRQDDDCRWSFSPAFRADTTLVAPMGVAESS